MENLTFPLRAKIAPSVMKSIDDIADDFGLNRSEAIRAALKLFIKLSGKLTQEQIQKLI